jgi:hypothetical protein
MIADGAENATRSTGGNRPGVGGIVVCALCRECSGYNTPRGERSSRLPVRRFRLPAPALPAGLRPEKPIAGNRNEELPLPRPALCPARRRAPVHAGGDRGKKSPRQHQPKKCGSKRGPRCCVSGLRRNQRSLSQPSGTNERQGIESRCRGVVTDERYRLTASGFISG